MLAHERYEEIPGQLAERDAVPAQELRFAETVSANAHETALDRCRQAGCNVIAA
jgi:hypothetical protein